MPGRGFVKGRSDELDYKSVHTTPLKEQQKTWRVAHSIAWTGNGSGYIVQKVKRIKEERECREYDKKFAWLEWKNRTVAEYYEAWYMERGRAFPRKNLNAAGAAHSTQGAQFDYDEERVFATSPDGPGAKYYNDTFSTTMHALERGATNLMIREAILGYVYFIPFGTQYRMSWYEKFREVAKHNNHSLPNGLSAGVLPSCPASAIVEPPFAWTIERKDLAIAWRHQVCGLETTGAPTDAGQELTEGFIDLTSPHIREKNIKLGKQVTTHGFFPNVFRHEDFKYQEWFKNG